MSTTVIPRSDNSAAPYQPMLTVVLAVICGIVADRLVVINWRAWYLAGMLALVLCMLTGRRYQRIGVATLLGSMIALSAAWHQFDWTWFPQHNLAFRLDEESRPVCLDVRLTSSPRRLAAPLPDPLCSFPQQQMTRVELRVVRVRDGRRWMPAVGKATLLVTGDGSHVSCGDLVRVRAFARRPPARENPGIDLLGSMRARRELFYLRAPSDSALRVVEHASGWSPHVWMERLREQICQRLLQQLGPDDSPLAAAMLVGAREQVRSQQRDAFFLTGTVHLLAISGLHVGVLAGLFWFITRAGLVNQRLGLSLAIAFVLFYCWLTGARPSIMRASILVTVLCLAELSFRPALPINTLATAAVLVFLSDPSSLFQPGTQLSFVAVLGLVRCRGLFPAGGSESADRLEKLVRQSRSRLQRLVTRVLAYCRRGLTVSLVVWSITAPLVLYYFHLVSPVGILLGLALGIPLAVVLVSGMATILLSGFGPFALLAVIPCRLGLWIMEWLIQQARDWPAAYFWSPAPPGWQLVVFYGLLFLCWSCRRSTPRRLLRACLLAWILVAAISTTRSGHRPEADVLRVTFIAVGHGTSVLLELPGDQVWLYDAGHLGRPDSAGRRVAAVLWSRGIRQIDRLLLSHADIDHINAVPYLLERFRVQQVCVPAQLDWSASPAVKILAEALARKRVPVHVISRGAELAAGDGLSARVLHPPAGAVLGSDNASSLVLELTWGARRLLLPGDLEADGLAMLLDSPPRQATVLMAPHHGSIYSQPLAICRWCRPRLVVISSGNRQASGEPAYRQWGSQLLSTRRHGAVTVEIRKNGLQTRTEGEPPGL